MKQTSLVFSAGAEKLHAITDVSKLQLAHSDNFLDHEELILWIDGDKISAKIVVGHVLLASRGRHSELDFFTFRKTVEKNLGWCLHDLPV